MPNQNRILLIVGVVLAILSVVYVQMYLRQQEVRITRRLMQGREPTPVLVASKDIPQDTVVTYDMLEVVTKPADAIEPRALGSPDEAAGKVVLIPISRGEQILSSKLEQVQRVSSLSMKVPSGKRAITIAIDTISGVCGFICTGDYVDIVGMFSLPGQGGAVPVTITILQRVQILAVGQAISEAAFRGKDQSANSANTVTLSLAPRETELVMFARAHGQIQLSLRSRADSAVVAEVKPMTQEALMALILGPQLLAEGQKAAQQAQAEKPPEGPKREVEIFRGLKREVITLQEAGRGT